MKQIEGLTPKQSAFVIHYLDNGFNGTRAAESAGYKGPESAWGVVAFQNIRKSKIAGAIARGMADIGMPEEEVVARISEIAKGNKYAAKDVTVSEAHRALESLTKVYGQMRERMELSGEVTLTIVRESRNRSNHQAP